jgi:hypothetical protein
MTTKIGKFLRTGTVLGVLALGLAACGPAAFPGAAPNEPVNGSPMQISSPSSQAAAGAGGRSGAGQIPENSGPEIGPITGGQGGADCPTTGVGQAQTGDATYMGSTLWDSGAGQGQTGAGQGQVGGADGQWTAQSGTVGAPVPPGAPAGGTTILPTPEELAKRLEQVNLGPAIPAGAGVGVPEPPGAGSETTTAGQGSDPEPVPADQEKAGSVGGGAVAPTGCK